MASRRAGPIVGVLVLLIVVAAVVAAIMVGSGGDDDSGSGGDEATSDSTVSQVTDRPTACRIELTALVNLSLGSDLNTLLGVIGSQSEFYAPTQISATTFDSDTIMYGNSEAQRRIGPVIAAQCTKAENPILTRGQMQDLLSSATASVDTDELKRIAVFA